MSYRCPLARLIPDRPDVEQIKQDGWRDHGILVVCYDDPDLDFVDREFVKRLGERLYGPKRCDAVKR